MAGRGGGGDLAAPFEETIKRVPALLSHVRPVVLLLFTLQTQQWSRCSGCDLRADPSRSITPPQMAYILTSWNVCCGGSGYRDSEKKPQRQPPFTVSGEGPRWKNRTKNVGKGVARLSSVQFG